MASNIRILLLALGTSVSVAAATVAGCGGSSESSDTTGAGGASTVDTGTNTGSNTGGSTTSTMMSSSHSSTGAGGGCGGSSGMDPSSFGAPCCSQKGGDAHCVPSNEIPATLAPNFASCMPTAGGPGLCVPDEIIKVGSSFVPAKCDSIGGAPGVCLSLCIDKIAKDPNVGLLQQGSCIAGDVCVPCVNPLTMMSTGACEISGCSMGMPDGGTTDAGDGGGITCPYMGPPILDPKMFPDCMPACGGAHCLPANLVPPAQQAQLAPCPGGFCTPDPFIESAGEGVPNTCTSVAGSEGRCLSVCLPLIASKANLLPSAGCGANEKCAPCYDPTSMDPNMPTGACSIACDKPANPPTILTCPYMGPPVIDPSIFPDCGPACAGAHCVPSNLVPPAQQAQLTPCNGGFCTPDLLVASAGYAVPAGCDPFPGTGAEGRCISDCIPAIGAQAAQLSQGSCNNNESCAPCTDPFAGTATGACTIDCDMPQQQPFTFPLCCDSNGDLQGTCVPSANVPPGQAGNLNQDICPANGANYLCVPNEYLPTPKAPVDNCTGTFGGLGTCVSQCVNISFSWLFGQDVCPDNHLCVDCALAPAGTPGCP